MKNKIITAILLSLLVVSIGINIWQYSKNNTLNVSVNNFQDDVINLNDDISEKDTEIANLSVTIDELKVSLDTAINDISNKDKEIEELKAELDEKDIDETVDVSVETDDKIVIIDGVEYLDIGGDDLTEDEIKAMLGDAYVPPADNTGSTPSGPVVITNPDGTTQTAKPGTGDDATGPEFPDIYVPDGTSIQ